MTSKDIFKIAVQRAELQADTGDYDKAKEIINKVSYLLKNNCIAAAKRYLHIANYSNINVYGTTNADII
jgi:predicted Zn-dependent peptidase